jgi:hypothetical protein
MAVYHPLAADDELLPTPERRRLTRLTQRENIVLNPTTSSGGEMILPFFRRTNALLVYDNSSQDMGRIDFVELVELKNAKGATEIRDLVVMVYAWMEDYSLEQPTTTFLDTPITQFAETGEISEGLSTVEKIATSAGKLPVIGEYAEAVKDVSSGLGKVADAFGFSKPNNAHEITDTRLRYSGTFAPVNDTGSSRSLTMDVANKLTIDPRTVGLSGEDEMTFDFICGRECLVHEFTWSETDLPDTSLVCIPVTPFIASSYPDDGLTDLPPSGYLATFFKYWRGTIQYRFVIPASSFHFGRLRCKYDPVRVTQNDDYHLIKSSILDIAESNVVTVEAGWGADRNYLSVYSGNTIPAGFNQTPDLARHNGEVVLSVVNGLVCPDIAENSVKVLVYMKCLPGMQFAVPSDRVLRDYSIDFSSTVNPIDPRVGPPDPPAPGVYPTPVASAIRPYFGTNNFEVLTFYYGWYTQNSNFNDPYLRNQLQDSSGNTPQVVDVPGAQPASPGEYYSNSQQTCEAQIDLMQAAGITGTINSWWGIGHKTDVTLSGPFATACTIKSFKYCILYEMSKYRTQGSWTWDAGKTSQLKEDMRYIKNNLVPSSAYIRKDMKPIDGIDQATRNGCPVIFLYVLRAWSETDQRTILDAIYEVFGEPGLYTGNVYIIADLAFGTPKKIPSDIQRKIGAISTYDIYGQAAKGKKELLREEVVDFYAQFEQWRTKNVSTHFIPVVSPGYNDRAVRLEANNIPLSRNLVGWDKSSLFKASLEQACEMEVDTTDANPWLLVNSWNEWHEDTQIEPTTTTGTSDLLTIPNVLTQGVGYEPYANKYLDILRTFTEYVGDPVPLQVAESGEKQQEEPRTWREFIVGIFVFCIMPLFRLLTRNDQKAESGETCLGEYVCSCDYDVTVHKDGQFHDLLFYTNEKAWQTYKRHYAQIFPVLFEEMKQGRVNGTRSRLMSSMSHSSGDQTFVNTNVVFVVSKDFDEDLAIDPGEFEFAKENGVFIIRHPEFWAGFLGDRTVAIHALLALMREMGPTFSQLQQAESGLITDNEMNAEKPAETMMEHPDTLNMDDKIFFGETICSTKAMIQRYTLAVNAYMGTASQVINFPGVPYFAESYPAATDNSYDTILVRIMCMYHGYRGSVCWKLLPRSILTNRMTHMWCALEPEHVYTKVGVDPADISPFGWTGIDYAPYFTVPLEVTVPYYSNNRFEYARTQNRAGKTGHSFRADTQGSADRLSAYAAAAPDFMCFYFAGVPSLLRL